MDEAELMAAHRNSGIRIRANGLLVGECACGGRIVVDPRGGDEGITLAVQRHNGSLLHRNARERWELRELAEAS